ncbi:YcjX family protein [Vibrio sonorensis]|uniref:YcjX family protein n=1 Tax=Vibrio sonorensis TaxID=1004316 RepID=UPI0008D9199B|nr:YcjX family protein [Vibrio sonorensis]
MISIKQEVNDLVSRSLDSHVRLAVTGLSRAGKTAFITSVVNQLLHTSTHDQLPLLASARDKRLLGAKRTPQSNMLVPRFPYESAIEQVLSEPPTWPLPTRDVSEIRLALKFKPTKRAKKLLGQTATLNLDIVDYPGEWLLDLPLLNMSFHEWSETQLNALQGKRKEFAKQWLLALETFAPEAEACENQLAEIAASFTQYLHRCKDEGLHWVQPGRFVLPGELEGAPVLQFFPYLYQGKASKTSNYAMLEARYKEYQQKVVKHFYRHHFSSFDRQIILVDCLSPLNAGHDSFQDMKMAIEQLTQSFRYGKSNLIKRLFSPRIDKLLFAATKADHITPEQHTNVVSLLQQMTQGAWQMAAYENIEMSCMSIASIQATQAGYISSSDSNYPAVQGTTIEGDALTLFPGEVPSKLPESKFWQQSGFDFVQFRPQPQSEGEPVKHIRIDKALEFLIGDKLK